jgi:putative heme iron utilization protein
MDKAEQARMARRLLRSVDSGILSTMSQELPGYPFGSVTPYALTVEGQVAIYVSGIAQHTHNMDGDSKVSLTVAAQNKENVNQQALGRVTVVGDARLLPTDEAQAVQERYFSFFPEAREYGGTHDFHIYSIVPKRVRFIGGFGKIFWVEEADWCLPTPGWSSEAQHIIDHMNTGHGESLLNMARQSVPSTGTAELVTLDTEGFHVRTDEGLIYLPFPAACSTTDEVRAAMVNLARAAG